MLKIGRWLPSVALVAFCSVGLAQITGPVPLAWRWAGTAQTSPYGAPLVDGDNVYVAVGSRVYCLDRISGNRKWQYPLVDPIDGVFGSNLLLMDGTLFAPGTNRTLYAIDPAKGEVKWTYNAPGGIVGKPVAAGKSIILNIDANSIVAISSEDGKQLFNNPERIFDGIKGDVFTIGTDVYYFTTRNDLYMTNVSTRRAQRLTRFQLLPTVPAPKVFGTSIYTVSGSVVMGLTLGGTPRWQRNLGDTLAFGPGVSPDGIVAITDMGVAHILDPNGGTRTMQKGAKTAPMTIDLGSRPIAAPSTVGKLFAVPTANGALHLIDPVKGELVWSYTIRPLTAGLKASNSGGANSGGNPGGTSSVQRGDEILSVPAVGPAVEAGSTLLVLAGDGSLLAFDNTNGVDLTGPSVKALWPQAGLQVGTMKGILDVYLQIADEASGVSERTLKVTVNGNPVEFDYGRDGVLHMRFGTGTKNGTLNNGRAIVEVTVADWMGNQTVTKVSYTIDNDLAPLSRPGGNLDNRGGPGGGRPGGGGPGGGDGKGGG